MPAGVKILTKLWLLFFLVTIVVIGLSFALPFYFPIYGLAKVFPRLKGAHDHILHMGIRCLMSVQPWLHANVNITVPASTKRGVLLVSNHRSHLDVFFLLARISGVRILAKSSLFQIPFLSLMMRASRQIGVERGRLDAWVRAMDEVKTRLRMGERVHVFPEMTRCPPNFHGLQPFTSGPFQAALQEDVLVVPLVFKHTDRIWPKGQSGLNFRGACIEVRTLPPLRARDYASVEQLKNTVHRQIEQALL